MSPRLEAKITKHKCSRCRGFSLIELVLVATVSLILAAMVIPKMLTGIRTAKLNGAMGDFTSLLQTSRIYAVRDNRFYSLYIRTASGNAPQMGYVDMLPKSLTGASGNGGTSVASGDPVITINSEVTVQPVANAPNTTNLSSQLLPATTTVTPTDAGNNTTPATFGPRGLPCLPLTVTVGGTSAGSICDTSGGPVAYWIFFQDNVTSKWAAVTATPAGRIQKWYYSGSIWVKF